MENNIIKKIGECINCLGCNLLYDRKRGEAMSREVFQLRLTPELREKLNKLAKDDNRTASDYLKNLIIQKYKELEASKMSKELIDWYAKQGYELCHMVGAEGEGYYKRRHGTTDYAFISNLIEIVEQSYINRNGI